MKKGVAPLVSYVDLHCDIRTRIQAAQSRAVLAANAQLIQLYWDIGRIEALENELSEPASKEQKRKPTKRTKGAKK